jgi:regulator of cell morphogenesis and NO signaling
MHRTESNDPTEYTIAEVALDFPQAIKILNRYNLDFCCHGKKSFREACLQNQFNPEDVWDEILHELPIPGGNINHRFDSWDIPHLIDFILQNHHQYIRLMIPQLKDLIVRIRINHEKQHPELSEVEFNFALLAEELLDHLPKEEDILFPVIKRIAMSQGSTVKIQLMANLRTPIVAMEQEHNNAGEILKLIRSLTHGYKAPANACPTFQLMYRLLEEFDDDLVQHIHLENNILFEKIKF